MNISDIEKEYKTMQTSQNKEIATSSLMAIGCTATIKSFP